MGRLLDSFREFQNPLSLEALKSTRSGSSLAAAVPVSFPESYPFFLLAHLPNSERDISVASTQSITPAYFNCGLAESATVFLVLVLSSPKKDILNFLDSCLEIEGKENFSNLLSQFFKVALSIINNEAFPANWLNINILAHKVLVKMFDPVAKLLERDFIPEQEEAYQFNSNLWREAIFVLLKLLSSEHLMIEEFSPQVWSISSFLQ